ncbi:hypothetical protein FRC09_016535, partial [Ceratobasidium sp. 395]
PVLHLALRSPSRGNPNSKAASVSRALLRALGRPDASGIEFNASVPEYYVCGICGAPGSFLSMVLHFLGKAKEWEDVQPYLSSFSSHGIAYNYGHDLESNNPKPLLNTILQEEADPIMLERCPPHSRWDRFSCKLCEQVMPKCKKFTDIPSLSSHLTAE